ncbi:hypothetical protein BTN49_1959 [Candidatus Enterovibrio escicola]|uniref:Uncharacterized protein n=1 Tax=Candidatus Enterovibrio escicola TaxID=1927127 RepID=A0A2A5T2N7_9GAMM|nr:hypothetical protein BTN49_1959 [Candidatus Enterovibrio escacola]
MLRIIFSIKFRRIHPSATFHQLRGFPQFLTNLEKDHAACAVFTEYATALHQ